MPIESTRTRTPNGFYETPPKNDLGAPGALKGEPDTSKAGPGVTTWGRTPPAAGQNAPPNGQRQDLFERPAPAATKAQAVGRKPTSPASSRPSLQDMWTHHQTLAKKGLPVVGDTLGGTVKKMIDSGTYTDGCVLRLSHALNESGVSMKSYFAKNPGSPWERVSGASGEKYMARTSEIAPFLTSQLGPPDQTIKNPSAKDLANFKGIVVFQWEPAKGETGRGHADLFDGTQFSGHGAEYLTTPQADGTQAAQEPRKNIRALLWRLPEKP